jgi:peptidoglycan/LPS O-acetylase OafA/YrhL
MKVRHSRYVPGLDLLRFFAASVVMIYHLAYWSWAYPDGQVARASRGVANFQGWDDLTSFGWAGVQIFFVISGFVIAISSEHANTYKFFTSRFIRLVPAVWICATITLIAWLLIDVGTTYQHVRQYIRSVAFHPLPPWIDSVYWTLGVEICFYSLVFVLLAVRRFRWIKPMMCCIGLISTLFWVGFWISAADRSPPVFALFSDLQWSRIGQLTLIQHGVFFSIGVLLWLQLTKQRTLDQTLWLIVFFIGGLLQIAGEAWLKLEKTGFAFSPLRPCAVWLGAMLFFWLAVANNARMQALPTWTLLLLRRLGLMTYPLYLLHNVAGGAMMGSLVSFGLSPAFALWITIASVTGLSWWVSAVPEPALQKLSRTVFDAIGHRWLPDRTSPHLTKAAKQEQPNLSG